tara:strand:- start:12498 stop:13094 length:597 start_codon:yes stop_codon:yes gene_type:complete
MYKFELLHHEEGSNFFYLSLGDKVIFIDISTPYQNDYYEWRFDEFCFILKDSIDIVNFEKPFELSDITITQKEYEFLDAYLCYNNDGFFGLTDKPKENKLNYHINKMREFIDKYGNVVNPLDYLDYTILTSIWYEGDDELSHFIYKRQGYNCLNMPENEIDKHILTSKFERPSDITQYQGMYNILIPLMEDIVNFCIK